MGDRVYRAQRRFEALILKIKKKERKMLLNFSLENIFFYFFSNWKSIDALRTADDYDATMIMEAPHGGHMILPQLNNGEKPWPHGILTRHLISHSLLVVPGGSSIEAMCVSLMEKADYGSLTVSNDFGGERKSFLVCSSP